MNAEKCPTCSKQIKKRKIYPGKDLTAITIDINSDIWSQDIPISNTSISTAKIKT